MSLMPLTRRPAKRPARLKRQPAKSSKTNPTQPSPSASLLGGYSVGYTARFDLKGYKKGTPMTDTADTFGAKRVDRSGNPAHKAYSETKVAVSDAMEDILASVGKLVEERPFAAAFGALAVGWLCGRMRRPF
jgi:hypothetical protein